MAVLTLLGCGADETTSNSTTGTGTPSTVLLGDGASTTGGTTGTSGAATGNTGTTTSATGATTAGTTGTTTGGTTSAPGGSTAGPGGSTTGVSTSSTDSNSLDGGSGNGGEQDASVAMPGDGTCLKGSGDFNDDGPYSVMTRDVSIGSQGMYTLFYPSPLEEDCPHPIVAWGNGTSVTGSGTYAFYNEHAASWGIVVVASHNSNVGSGEFHRAGLDYLLEQNEDSSSEFFGKLSPRAGTSGHSQGGMGANAGASHPNVEAIGNVQGAFGRAPADAAFLCLTGTEDIAVDGCRTAVNGTSSPALYANWEGGTHTGTATIGGFIGGDEGTMQYRRFYTAWFRCFLADDEAACGLFQGGESCPVCQESGWAEIFANNF